MTFKEKFYYWLYKKTRGLYRRNANRLFLEETKREKSHDLYLSHHAILRYFERVHGFDIDELTKDITSAVKERRGDSGDGKYTISDGKQGYRATVVKNTIVTIDDGFRDIIFPEAQSKRVPANPIRGVEQLRKLPQYKLTSHQAKGLFK